MPIAHVKHEPRLPSEEDSIELGRSLGAVLERLSLLGYGIRAVIEPYLEGEEPLPLVPTYEDIGRLYELIRDLESDQWAIGQEIEGFKKSIGELCEVRLEGSS